jgi:hypothetical protein
MGRSGKIIFTKRNINLLNPEEDAIRHPLVGFQLSSSSICDFRSVQGSQGPRFLGRDDSIGPTCLQVQEGGGHDTVVHKLEGAPPELRASNMSDRITGASVHFYEHDEFLDLVTACGFIEIDQPAP